jgi:DNA-binding CsgD family transcriptional regulator
MVKEKILELKKEGKSYRQIQKILNCSKGTISYHLGENQKEKTN